MNTQEIRKNPEIAIWLPESARGIYKQHIIKRETKSRLYKDQPSNLKKVFNKMHADYELLMKKINLQVIKHGRNKSTPGKNSYCKQMHTSNDSSNNSNKKSGKRIVPRPRPLLEKIEEGSELLKTRNLAYTKKKNKIYATLKHKILSNDSISSDISDI